MYATCQGLGDVTADEVNDFLVLEKVVNLHLWQKPIWWTWESKTLFKHTISC